MSTYLLLVCFFCTALVSTASLAKTPPCKAVPGSPNWPTQQEWQALDKALNGNLLAGPLPPAIVCDQTRPKTYSKAACSTLDTQWFNSSLHANSPVSVDWPNWQDDACLPTILSSNGHVTCDLTPFPNYVINASQAEHVATGIKFAATHLVRLSVKGTGHDLLGRSTSPGLSIWTHHLRGITLHDSFTPQSCGQCKGVPAVTVAAGHQWRDVYSVASGANRLVIGGGDPDVGMGGFLTGGGHSPISGKFGLASDNVVEMQLVTPTGNIVTANDHQHQDLFWAMRGGGGATFGVLISATMKTHPIEPLMGFVLQFNSTAHAANTNNNAGFFSAAAYLNTQLPTLSEKGLMGYYYLNPITSTTTLAGQNYQSSGMDAESPVPMTLSFFGGGLNMTYAAVSDAFNEINARLSKFNGINTIFYVLPPTTLDLLALVTSSPGSVGVNVRVGSRLLDKTALSDESKIEKALRAFEKTGLQGIFTSGPGVRSVAPDASAVNPAWRRAYLHALIPITFPAKTSPQSQNQLFHNLTHNLTATLRSLAPDTGCYVNEADPDEPDFERAFWGSHYEKLLEIKRRYDPGDVLWCRNCVGGSRWVVKEGEVCRMG